MTEEQLKQEIYNVLNTHNPTTCTDKPCKAVTTLMSLFTHQLELAKIEAKIEALDNIIGLAADYANSGHTLSYEPAIKSYISELTKQKDLLTKESK